MILMSLSFSMFLIHLFPWPYGSMNSGHLLAFEVMMAFSMEKVSEGRPWVVQLRIFIGSPSTLCRLNAPELGISFSRH